MRGFTWFAGCAGYWTLNNFLVIRDAKLVSEFNENAVRDLWYRPHWPITDNFRAPEGISDDDDSVAIAPLSVPHSVRISTMTNYLWLVGVARPFYRPYVAKRNRSKS